MTERISMEEAALGSNFLSWAFITMLAKQFDFKDTTQAQEARSFVEAAKEKGGYDIEIKIDGVEFSFREVLKRLEEDFDRQVNLAAGKKVQEIFGERVNQIQTILDRAKNNLDDELRKNNLLNEYD